MKRLILLFAICFVLIWTLAGCSNAQAPSGSRSGDELSTSAVNRQQSETNPLTDAGAVSSDIEAVSHTCESCSGSQGCDSCPNAPCPGAGSGECSCGCEACGLGSESAVDEHTGNH